MQYSHLKEFSYDSELPEQFEAKAIGWLGKEVPLSGEIGADCIDAIRFLHSECRISSGQLGYHTCGICNRYQDRGEVHLKMEGQDYLLPRMILHYIDEHKYLPPIEFLDGLERWWSWHRKAEQTTEAN
ncbi:hypothetical protein GCM10007100_40360 [Roseibacillus persicicus]|uniref:DUF7919 domain-containing protein n=2 Tax=Roseibacillus persicicus TaxID=454148 RepID=A0A918WQM6_9BACT|nr:hypothetical protein GCM10007100_40360 [Roseibacillus persicicus]